MIAAIRGDEADSASGAAMDVSPASPAVTTLADRKRAEADRRRRAADKVVQALEAYARREEGCFVVFGSYVTDAMRCDSDLDVMIDGPIGRSGEAWRFVEATCAEHGIKPDIHDAATSRLAFVHRVRAQGRVLP